jgi:hypothetical protein
LASIGEAAMENVLPEGYRFRLVWIGWGKTMVAGRMVRREWIRVVQRLRYTEETASLYESWDWEDVGYWDEVFPSLAKDRVGFPEL